MPSNYYINYIIIMEHVLVFFTNRITAASHKKQGMMEQSGGRERGKKNSPTDTFLPNLIPSDQASIAFTSQTAK